MNREYKIWTEVYAIKESLKYATEGEKTALQFKIVGFKFPLWAEAIRWPL